MISLRPYQQQAVDATRHEFAGLPHGSKRVLFVLPTGGGKTVTFCYITHNATLKGRNVLILAHRDELLTQISDSLRKFDIPHGIIGRGRSLAWHKVQVASVQTYARRISNDKFNLFFEPQLIILDEAHHAVAGQWAKILNHYPAVPVLGVTATPVRGDGKGLGSVFNKMVLGPTPAQLMEWGFLVPCVVYGPPVSASLTGLKTKMGDFDKKQIAYEMDKPVIWGEAVGHYKNLALNKRIIVFCVNRQHMEHTVDAYRQAGIESTHIDGTMDAVTRKQRVTDFTNGQVKVLVSCEIISEGFDVPACDGIQSLRPTQSLGLYLQQVGRGLRPAPGKDHCLHLDHVGNTMRHGFTEDEREWDLNPVKKRAVSSESAESIYTCLNCYCTFAKVRKVCPRCGTVIPIVTREDMPDSVSGELQQLKPASQLTPEEKQEMIANAQTLVEFHAVARRLGYKPGWAMIQYRQRKEGSHGYA